jgi:hypothetical protein
MIYYLDGNSDTFLAGDVIEMELKIEKEIEAMIVAWRDEEGLTTQFDGQLGIIMQVRIIIIVVVIIIIIITIIIIIPFHCFTSITLLPFYPVQPALYAYEQDRVMCSAAIALAVSAVDSDFQESIRNVWTYVT